MLKITKFFLFIGVVLFSLNSFSQVGINTDTPNSMLDINGNLSVATATLPGGAPFFATPITDQGVYYSLNPSDTAREFLLPRAQDCRGRIYILRNISSSYPAVLYINSVPSSGGQFFAKNSISSTTSVSMPFTGELKTAIFISDGTNWTYIF